MFLASIAGLFQRDLIQPLQMALIPLAPKSIPPFQNFSFAMLWYSSSLAHILFAVRAGMNSDINRCFFKVFVFVAFYILLSFSQYSLQFPYHLLQV